MENLFVLAWSAQEMVHNTDGENEVLRLLNVIQDRINEVTQKLARLCSYFPEEVES